MTHLDMTSFNSVLDLAAQGVEISRTKISGRSGSVTDARLAQRIDEVDTLVQHGPFLVQHYSDQSQELESLTSMASAKLRGLLYSLLQAGHINQDQYDGFLRDLPSESEDALSHLG